MTAKKLSFYQLLQLNPVQLNQLILATNDLKKNGVTIKILF